MGRFSETTRTRQARFPSIGTTVSGTVIEISEAAIPEFDGGRIIGPKFDATTGAMVTQTDVLVETDNGKTLIHTRGGIAVAIGQALVKIKADDLEVGDQLAVTFESEEETDGDFSEKVFSATVTKAGKASKK